MCDLYDSGICTCFNLERLDLTDWIFLYTLFMMSFGSPSQIEISVLWNFHTEHTLLTYSSEDPWGVQPLVEVRTHICFLEYKPWKPNIWPRASCVVTYLNNFFFTISSLPTFEKLLSQKLIQFHWVLVLLLGKGRRIVLLSPLWFWAWIEAGFTPLPQCSGAWDTE